MAEYTLAEITAFYEAAKTNYLACLNSKEYSIKDRELKRENLDTLRTEMNRWKDKMDSVTAGDSQKKKVSMFVPRDY